MLKRAKPINTNTHAHAHSKEGIVIIMLSCWKAIPFRALACIKYMLDLEFYFVL